MDLNIIMTTLLGLLGAIGAYLIVIFQKGKKREIYTIVKTLVDEAENKFGAGTGEIKYEYVVEKLYSILPIYIKLFISNRLLDLWIETAVNELQEFLDEKIKESNEEAK